MKQISTTPTTSPSNVLAKNFIDACAKSLNGHGPQYVDKALEISEELRLADLEPHEISVVVTMWQEFVNAGPDLIASEL